MEERGLDGITSSMDMMGAGGVGRGETEVGGWPGQALVPLFWL